MKTKLFLFLVVLFFIFSCTKENSEMSICQTSNQTSDVVMKSAVIWDALTQTQKDDRIIGIAYLDSGRNVGIECKPWVNEIVPTATSNHVSVPGTGSNGYSWLADPSGHIVGRKYYD